MLFVGQGQGQDDKPETGPPIVPSITAVEMAVEMAVNTSATSTNSVPGPIYFASLREELRRRWPNNRNLRFVFHGHSVPAGFFKTPRIQRFDSYPMLFQQTMCDAFPTAQIDVSVTAIGGENSKSGAERFGTDVLALKPDVVFIDYSLNDRQIGLEQSERSWRHMIQSCIDQDIKVVLLTPTPDSRERIADQQSPLAQHANQVKRLAAEFNVPVIDSYGKFRSLVGTEGSVLDYLSQVNHPNRKGHQVVAKMLTSLFIVAGNDGAEENSTRPNAIDRPAINQPATGDPTNGGAVDRSAAK